MSLTLNWQWFVALLLDRMLICLVGGTVLAGVVSLLWHLVPKKNSRTRFAVWLSTLIAIAVLPVLRMQWKPWSLHDPRPVIEHALFTLPPSWAAYLVSFWAVVAVAGLLRVMFGLWTLRRLRRGCTEIPLQLLGRELAEAITEVRKMRPISILVSPRVEVPGAIGFLRPAIVLPSWLAEDLAATELKYVVLHELAHLRRWDDWTNLAQKLVKAFLFFHPAVWWIERKLFIDREMACDDAVVARAGGARVYAQCLARVAEKSFLRRQFALAQAVVDRAHQLSLRVTQILNGEESHPRAKALWKPALPIVTGLVLLLAYATSQAPDLVLVSGTLPTPGTRDATGHATSLNSVPAMTQTAAFHASARQARMSSSPRDAFPGNASGNLRAWFVPALYALPKSGEKGVAPRLKKHVSHPHRDQNVAPKLAAFSQSSEETPTAAAQPDAIDQGDGGAVLVFVVSERLVVRDMVVRDVVARDVVARDLVARDLVVRDMVVRDLVATDQAGFDRAEVLQVNMWEVHWIVPANRPAKLIPRKT